MQYDLIIGLPTIRRHDLTRRFRNLFVEARNGYRALHPEATVEQLNALTAIHRHTQRAPPTEWDAIARAVDLLRADLRNETLNVLVPKEQILGKAADEELEDLFLGEDDDLVASFAQTEAERAARQTTPAEDRLPKVVGDFPLAHRTRALLEEFPDIFSRVVGETPASITPMPLLLDKQKWQEQLKQLQAPPRRQSPMKNAEILRQINQMLALGVIKPSQAPYRSQVLLAKKANGKWRFCIDYRILNLCIEAFGWPLPNISHMIQRIGDRKPQWFGVIDTTSGYHQLLLSEECSQFAAFVTEFGVYEPTRVAFGIKTAPSYFQQKIAGEIMAGLNYVILEMYIDDILTYAQTEDEYIENLRKIFERLRQFKITLNPDKCRFCLREVEFVGHLITRHGVKFSPEKIRKVFDFELPTTAKQLRSFLGLANYFHSHVKDYSSIVQPLHALLTNTKKAHRLYWTSEDQAAFERIKQMISANQQLFFWEEDKGRVIVETDASNYAIGGVCYQLVQEKSEQGETIEVRRPLKFFSKSLTAVQRRW
ncbi:MAG: hypothetical protein K2Z81_07040, partial [Cyanobacteria bacterium]|nr:hypothetical protein [Cyanobacteriota bacterium]